MQSQPQKEHHWLDRLVGDWVSETEASMVPDRPPVTMNGVQVIRSLGGLWIYGEGEGGMPGHDTSKNVITLGYDSTRQRYVGTYIASVMSHLWVYDGSLDPEGRRLILDSEGPGFSGEAMAKYQDIIEIIDDDHWILTSQVLNADGRWHHFMTVHYRRNH